MNTETTKTLAAAGYGAPPIGSLPSMLGALVKAPDGFDGLAFFAVPGYRSVTFSIAQSKRIFSDQNSIASCPHSAPLTAEKIASVEAHLVEAFKRHLQASPG